MRLPSDPSYVEVMVATVRAPFPANSLFSISRPAVGSLLVSSPISLSTKLQSRTVSGLFQNECRHHCDLVRGRR